MRSITRTVGPSISIYPIAIAPQWYRIFTINISITNAAIKYWHRNYSGNAVIMSMAVVSMWTIIKAMKVISTWIRSMIMISSVVMTSTIIRSVVMAWSMTMASSSRPRPTSWNTLKEKIFHFTVKFW